MPPPEVKALTAPITALTPAPQVDPPVKAPKMKRRTARMARITPQTVAPVEGPLCCGDGGDPWLVTQVGGVVQVVGAAPRTMGVIGPKPDVMNQTTPNRPTAACPMASVVKPAGREAAGYVASIAA